MAKNNGKKSSENGLEIDRINLSNISSNAPRKPMPAADQKPSPSSESKFRNKKVTILTLAISLSVLALALVFSFFFKQQSLTFTYLSGEKGPALENHLQVGPISATLANDDIINLTVDIDCKNNDIMKQLDGKDSLIRDKILDILTAPDTTELLNKQQYNEIKTRIRKSLADISSDDIGPVYISDLLIY